MRLLRCIVVLASGLTFGACGVARAANDGAFASRELRIIVGSESGGGYDVYARLASPFLGKYLPGAPTVIVQNLPGAGGLKVANYMAKIAPRDGSTIAITNRNLIAAPLLKMVDRENVQYDPMSFTWLANLNTDVSFLIARAATGVASLDDLRGRDFIVGSTTPTDNNGLFPYIFNNLLGTRFRVVSGYPSSNEMALAMDRSEIDGVVGFSWSSLQAQRPDWLRDGYVRLLMQLGLTPHPEARDVPLMLDFVRDDINHQALELIATLNTLGRPFFGPPGMPSEAVKNLREAFAHVAVDTDFLEMARRENLDVTFTDGATLQETVARMNSVRPEIAAAATRALARRATSVDSLPKR